MTDVATLVEKAKEKGTFSVLDVAKGRGRTYPEDFETVYMDVASAYKIKQLEAENADETDNAAHEARVAEIDRLRGEVATSALTFHMRGIGEGVKDTIRKQGLTLFPEERDLLGNVVSGGVDYGDGADWYNAKVFAEHIIDVTDFEGNVDEHRWTVEEVNELRAALPDESYNALVALVFKLSFASAYFDASVTPDFS